MVLDVSYEITDFVSQLPPRSINQCFLPSFNLSKIEVLLQQSTSVSSNNKLSYNKVIPLFIILYILETGDQQE
jgi:hypothetical protein